MIWFLSAHIMALLIWCASLLFLLSLTVVRCPSRRYSDDELTPRQHDSVVRRLFTVVSTPAALLAIASGTAVFLLQATTEPWLIMKLTLVALLVVCHALSGGLILRIESGHSVRSASQFLVVLSALLTLTIVWLVLARPAPGDLLWL